MTNKRSIRRVYVKTIGFEGWAVVDDVVDCASYPLSITLEAACKDGHRRYRVCDGDIVEEERYSVDSTV